MKLKFLFGGREKADLFQEGIEDYLSRIKRDFPVAVLFGKKGEQIAKFLNHLPHGGYLIGLAEDGKSLTSLEFAQLLERLIQRGAKEVIFLVGGADGLEPSWREKCDTLLSLSPLTFNHQLARLILLEQVYRALSIIQKRPYHR